jgi:hypothetical protein
MAACERIDELVRLWERTGALEAEELARIEGHVRECPRCAGLHGALLLLLRHDAGQLSTLARPAVSPSPGFVAGVMGRVGATKPPRASSGRRRVLRWAVPAAAAAALLIAAGVFLGPRLAAPQNVVAVRFELVAPDARSVSLVGDFNGWRPDPLALKDASGAAVWEITLPLRTGTTYRYEFVIDGTRWVPDPASPTQVEDGFGGTNSVLRL